MDQFFGVDAGCCFDIVDVLRVVGQELSFLLEHGDELMGWREIGRTIWDDIAGDLVKERWVLFEDRDVKNLLWIVETEFVSIFRVKAMFRTEIRNTKRSRDTGTSEDNDVLRFLDQLNGIINRVVLR